MDRTLDHIWARFRAHSLRRSGSAGSAQEKGYAWKRALQSFRRAEVSGPMVTRSVCVQGRDMRLKKSFDSKKKVFERVKDSRKAVGPVHVYCVFYLMHHMFCVTRKNNAE